MTQRPRVELVDGILDRIDGLEVAGHRGVHDGADEGSGVDRPDGRVGLDAFVELLDQIDRIVVARQDDIASGQEIESAGTLARVVIGFGRDPDVEVQTVQGDVWASRRPLECLARRWLEAHLPPDDVCRCAIELPLDVDPQQLADGQPATQGRTELKGCVGAFGVEQPDGDR